MPWWRNNQKEIAVRNPKRSYQRKASEKGALKLKRSYRTS
nr:MAG TPA: hypothetical protein [Caudoviricetes sp.]